MRLAHDHARVRVPATSGNLGPGFDCLGMAHDVWDEVSATLTTGATRVTILGEGAKDLPHDESHLIVKVMRETLERFGLPCGGIDLVCRNSIQQGRGLGSSAAAVVAGLMLVRGLIDQPHELNNEALLSLAMEYEGHPDNAAPCIYGGVTLSWTGAEGAVQTVQLPVHSDVRVTLLVPSEILPTSEARAVLPSSVPHADAAFEASRSALLVHALEHRPELLFDATEECLHQGYRAASMPHSAAMLKALRDAGWPAVVSGAGPSLLLFAPADPGLTRVAQAQGFHVIDSRIVGGAELLKVEE